MKKRISILIAISLISLISFPLKAQRVEKFDAYSKLLSPEKLYLHIDKDTYCAGDTIWFKGYLKNNSVVAEFPESNYIYVELIGYQWNKDVYSGKTTEEGRIMERIKVKRRDGVLQGYVKIPEDINSGKSILRAFTYWDLNFDTEYIFNRNIEIINPTKDRYLEDLIAMNVKERSKYSDVGLKYPFDKEKIRPNFDCQFFAESGHFLIGTDNIIGVKAVGENGLGTIVHGEVFDSHNNIVSNFTTNEFGFAKFRLAPTASTEKFRAVVKDERGVEKELELPNIETVGISINLSRTGGNIISKLNSVGVNTQSLFFILFDGTELFYQKPYNEVVTLAIPIDNLPVGVVNAAVVDEIGNIYATRAFFVMPDPQNVTLTQDKEKYGVRELAKIGIDVKNKENKAVKGDFSISVTDNVLAPYSGHENNIVSYMLLGSEIKGYIQEPQRFFDLSKPLRQREEEVDLLLLTQGWRYYDIEKILKGENTIPRFGREYIQTVSGYVKARKNRPSYVSFVAPSINFSALGQLDSSGYFELKDINFPDSTLFIVNAVGVGVMGKRQFIPYIDEDNFAPMLQYLRNNKDTVENAQIVKSEMLEKMYIDGSGPVYQLNPVYIKSNKKYSINDPSPYGGIHLYRPDQLREGKALEPFGAYDLMTYVYETCQGLRLDFDTTSGEKILKCRVPRIASEMEISDGWEEIVVFINGIQAFTSAELNNYMVDDIVSLVYLKGGEASIYVPTTDGSPSVRSAIMIKTKINTRTGLPRNVTKGYPLGWQRVKKIYTPVYTYQNSHLTPKGSDRRSTVYWNPEIKIDESGKTNIEFYTSDTSAGYTIILEGVTDEGEYVFVKQPIVRK